MKKILLFILLISTTLVNAQDLIKVKGNREVTTEISPMEPFEFLEISGDYEIEIVSGVAPQIEITTDSNLHQYLAASVVDGKLVVTTTARIRSKKEMKFRIIYGPKLKKITVTEDAQLSSVTSLVFEELELNIEKDAEVYLTATVENLVLNADSTSESELNLTGSNAFINLKDKAKIKALINYDSFELIMKDRTNAVIEGDIKSGKLAMNDRTSFKGEKLIFDQLGLKISNSAAADVNVKDQLELESSDSAKVDLYNTPKIDVKKFDGKSVLSKK